MQCHCSATSRDAKIPDGTVGQSANNLASKITFNTGNITCTGTASTRACANINDQYCRAGFDLHMYLGTKSALKRDISKYSKLVTTQSNNKLNAAFRTGNINAVSTTTSTATVVKSGGAASLDLSSIPSCLPSLVLGNSKSEGAVSGNGSAGYPAVSADFSTVITEIYLV